MVKITSDLIIRHGSHSKKQNYENDVKFLRRLTHIYLQERHIDEIANLDICKNLSVLYLYDNKIKSIRNLSFAVNLTHLYLQKNQITRIDGLNRLTRLSKLYLGNNSITVVEGLEGCENLTELHIENQRLPSGESLLFDPRTLESVARTLCVLNVSGNNLVEVSELSVLIKMTQFFASSNQISDMYDLSCAVRAWPSLSRLELNGNPCCTKPKYRDKIILMSNRLVMLDGKEVNEATRLFLQSWHASKKKTKRRTYKQTSHDENSLMQGNIPAETGLPKLPLLQSLTSHSAYIGQYSKDHDADKSNYASFIANTPAERQSTLTTDGISTRFPNIHSTLRNSDMTSSMKSHSGSTRTSTYAVT